LGFSTRHVSGLFNAFRVSLAHMSVWRDVQKCAAGLRACLTNRWYHAIHETQTISQRR
jgi:hypothetical protein